MSGSSGSKIVRLSGASRRHEPVVPRDAMPPVCCVFCGSSNTEPVSIYGCHMMVAQYYCGACRTSFDWVRDD